jgi:hypothetical protein
MTLLMWVGCLAGRSNAVLARPARPVLQTLSIGFHEGTTSRTGRHRPPAPEETMDRFALREWETLMAVIPLRGT